MYREVTMIELREVLRLWQEHLPKKRIAARLGLDPKTVRRYLRAAEAAGLPAQVDAVSDEQLRDVLLALQPTGGRPRGDAGQRKLTLEQVRKLSKRFKLPADVFVSNR